ncbi:hypothetical protein [Marinobacterium mangrovicola]|uniref:Periplasmic binding family protein n=1 Tax=Marinobacterium mangrovicola TaxID=1476959 RepID=A0A4R1GJU5_9GAMM|nr:hypothetical protein [Marinobacterium mangrovicola]TCK08298.1 hypothetical protein CLV83_0372 [Marinobacterium mangrovicola]
MNWMIKAVWILLAFSGSLYAGDILVVVSKDSPVDTITKRELVDLYMGRSHSLPDGSPVMKIDAPVDSPVRAEFYQALIGMKVSEVNAYWARLMFTGRATPPMSVTKPEDVAGLLARNPSALGYLPEDSENEQLKTIFVIKEDQGAP